MKYCLSVDLHNLFFYIAVVDNTHNIVNKYKCNYNRSKDISSNIHDAYLKHFYKYNIEFVGVGVSNNICFKDDILYSVKSFGFDRYNLKHSLNKLFKVEIIILEETYLASLAVYDEVDSRSLLYLVLDNKISNSLVVDNQILELEEDINLRYNQELNDECCKDSLKAKFLSLGLDDEYIGGYFISNDKVAKSIVIEFAKELNKHLEKIVKEIKVDRIVFAGYIGEYFEYFKEYLNISKKIMCSSISNHKEKTLIGISHLIFKDIR